MIPILVIVIIVCSFLVEPLETKASHLDQVEVLSFPYKKSYEEDPAEHAKNSYLELLTIEQENKRRRNEAKQIEESRRLAEKIHEDELRAMKRVKTFRELLMKEEQRKNMEVESNKARLEAEREAEELRLLAERIEMARTEADRIEEQKQKLAKELNDAKIAAARKAEEERALAEVKDETIRETALREEEQRKIQRQISEARVAAANKQREVQVLADLRDKYLREVAKKEEEQRIIESDINSAAYTLAQKAEEERILLREREKVDREEEEWKRTQYERNKLDRFSTLDAHTDLSAKDNEQHVKSGFQETIYPEKALLPVKSSRFATLRSKLSGITG